MKVGVCLSPVKMFPGFLCLRVEEKSPIRSLSSCHTSADPIHLAPGVSLPFLWESHPSAFTPSNPPASIIPGKCSVTIEIRSEKQKNNTTDCEEKKGVGYNGQRSGRKKQKQGGGTGYNCENSQKVKADKCSSVHIHTFILYFASLYYHTGF